MILELDTIDRGRDLETDEVYVKLPNGYWRPAAASATPAEIYERDRGRVMADLRPGLPHAIRDVVDALEASGETVVSVNGKPVR